MAINWGILMRKTLFSRQNQMILIFLIVFLIMGWRLHDLTITEGDYYYQKSINNRIKKIETYARRGNIYDRNGALLATSDIGFVLEFNSGVLTSDEQNDLAIRLYDFLETQHETHLEFPIRIENGHFYYAYDRNIDKWLEENGYSVGTSAKTVFDDIRSVNYIDEDLSDYEAYRILYNQGKYLPISTSRMMFTDDINKKNFLDLYGLDEATDAKEAFSIIRKRGEFDIDDSYSDEDAYKILIIKHAIKEKGYLKYEPITVADSISKETAVLIQEEGYDFPGVNVTYKSIRKYPYGASAAHLLGYMGKIASDSEIDKYVDANGYNPNQLIGKTGIEGKYELELHGQDGYKYIEADVYGKYVADVDEADYGLDTKPSISGEDIYSTIDINLQIVLENSLEKALKQVQVGGTFESPWGDYNYSAFPQAETGAGVVVDVNTGEVLAMASYPSYDVNLFSNGISQEDWNNLNPVNKRNPLAARPLYNMATMMAVQPGSTFKMATGYAAMAQGLDPNEKLYSNGYIEIGNQRYGCWYWNDYHLKHGPTNFFEAIEQSCNYYFFDIASGKDYYRDKPLDYEITPQILIDRSKAFGLDEKTGVEIGEVSLGVPDPDKKKRTIKILLERALKESVLKKYFPEDIMADEDKVNAISAEIVSWSDENPSRGDIIKRLIDLGANDDYYITENLADVIKYDYFNLMKWYEGDTLNLAIGQGDHTYTPVQVARYIATIANDGYVKDFSVIKKVGNTPVVKNKEPIESVDIDNHLDDIRKGMLLTSIGSAGTARKVFQDFPVQVAGKTGTAEKEGLIPPLDEIAYLTEYLSLIDPSLDIDEVDAKTIDIVKERSEELSQLEKDKDTATDETIKAQKETKLNSLIDQDYLNKGSAMREAIKELSSKELTDDDINAFRLPYDNYAWYVSFAPYDNPQIAVVILIPQGGHGGYGAPVARDVYAQYFGLEPPSGD